MQTNRLVFPLFLLFSFGQMLCVNFGINKFSEALQDSEDKIIGVVFTHGRTNGDSFTSIFSSQDSGFVCVHMKSRAKIYFQVPQKSKLEINLNIDFFTGSFIPYDSYNVEASWGFNIDICFIFGTWYPAENNPDKKLELYMRFIRRKHSIQDREILYLTTISWSNKLYSRLFVRKNSANRTAYANEKIKEIKAKLRALKAPKGVQEETAKRIERSKTKHAEMAIWRLIYFYDQRGQTILGDQRCDISKDTKFSIKSKLLSLALKGEGEFNMGFYVPGVSGAEEELFAANFAKLGTTDAVLTKWADLKCGKNGVDFNLKYKSTESKNSKNYDNGRIESIDDNDEDD